MVSINLSSLELKTFTEQNALDYCQLNNINPDNIIELNLGNNKLTDISGIKLFKNLQNLFLSYNLIKNISIVQYLNILKNLSIGNNQITDISVLKYLKKLKKLGISNLELESDQIKYIKSLEKLETLISINGFKDMLILDELNKRKLGIFK